MSEAQASGQAGRRSGSSRTAERPFAARPTEEPAATQPARWPSAGRSFVDRILAAAGAGAGEAIARAVPPPAERPQ